MRALTVQQPWAWAIIHGGKNIENRTQAWSYRGPLAIHAGLREDPRAGEFGPLVDALRRYARAAADALLGRSRRGVIIGVVDLVDVHWCTELEAADRDPDPHDCCWPWGWHEYAEQTTQLMCEPVPQVIRRPQVTHLVLENPRPVATPIPARGALGLWNLSADVLEQIQEQLR